MQFSGNQETMEPEMLEILSAALICALTLRALAGSLVTQEGQIRLPQVELGSLRTWILMSLAAILVLRPLYGTALVLALLLHELGHVMAHRMLGHTDARFRLAPLVSNVPVSQRKIPTLAQDFFVTIMGAGFSIAPMVVALVAASLFKGTIPGLYEFFFALGTAIGALNFVNLLPLLPLDGGRCLRQILVTLSPRTGIHVILTISAGAAALSFVQESMSLITLVCLGGLVFFRPDTEITEKAAMSKGQASLAFAAYGFTIAAHATGGWYLIRWYFW
mgnify:CR=1 FL=1